MGAIDLAAAKAQLNIPANDTSSDDEIERYINAATDVIEHRCGPVSPTQVVEVVTGRGVLALSTMPVISVQSVVGQYAWALPVDVSTLLVDKRAGLIYRPDGVWFSGPTTVAYTAGRDPVPGALQTACAILVQHLWETQNGSGSNPNAGGDDTSMAYGFGYLVPNRAAELMEPFLSAPGIA